MTVRPAEIDLHLQTAASDAADSPARSGAKEASTVSPFVAEWLPRAAAALNQDGRRPCALDLAMGEGRHACLLGAAGFITFGVDRSLDRLSKARAVARARGLELYAWAADLDDYPLPRERFDLLLGSRFLLRARWGDLKALLKPGGFVIYETFTIGQLCRGTGPSSPDHLLQPGELRAVFADWHILLSEEVTEPAALARLVARKPDMGR